MIPVRNRGEIGYFSRYPKQQNRLRISSNLLMGHKGSAKERNAESDNLRRDDQLSKTERVIGTRREDVFEFLEWVAGRAKRLPLVARYDGKVFGGDESEPDAVSNDRKFNLPCAPLILIASSKGQEGIDLHHYCRRVVMYDLPWNPAVIEQRIGRVHRLGGIRSRKRPVEVVYCYQKGSYEELIAKRVKQRCKMMHALLGAGTWLDEDREVDNLDRYRMTFPP